MTYGLLDKIDSPKDIKALSLEELRELCSQLRSYMIDCCAVNPGHLGSSLGAVELIVGLHKVYDTPRDKIVFDVGHQAYAHKILTGRREAFKSNRKREGISGFTRREESVYDAFGVGHSSTSISAALGLATAARLQGSDEKVVAVIGDGALTGGLAYEGLNNAGASKADLLVVLNDNNFSIDRNLGAVHEHLLRLTTNATYNRIKTHLWNRIGENGFRNTIRSIVANAKHSIIKQSGGDIFEAMGFRYFGPIDGNDMEQVLETLQKIKNLPGPRVLHIITTKGKGYAPAERQQTIWHAPGTFDPETGARICNSDGVSRYQDVFGEVLTDLASKDESIVGITPAMSSGCGMNVFAKAYPDRFFDVGIAEEHAVTFSAGLAARGMRPFCNIYSSFSQRAYDQIIHDVALQNLPVVLCFDRAGLVGEDGATHHGCYDMAAYRSVPNAVIAVPSDEVELKNMMYTASRIQSGPFIIRYPRGKGENAPWKESEYEVCEVGRGVCVLEGKDVAVVAAGPVLYEARKAVRSVEAGTGKKVSLYNIRYVKPVDTALLDRICKDHKTIITVEDGCVEGGLHGAVAEYVADVAPGVRVIPIGVPDRFIAQDTQKNQRAECGLTADAIEDLIRKLL
ncbi:MAG: 1-deoxy-D-xylulose-5-phosphate synthase [Candidatus Cryptobacteroides sp.]|nr:1-deoxy-D-xylulose-5-phosphate synthase [Candidatus Cryptobacteroides sp.]